MHDEDDTLNFYPLRQNINAYIREEKNFGDDSSVFLPNDGHLGDTAVPENTYLGRDKIPDGRDSFL